jgi:tetratricopeptide (TPR) repeat protein
LTARTRLARLLAFEGKNNEAKELIAEVLKKNATDGEALMVRAGLSLTERDAAAAVVDLRNLLRDQPNHIQALKLLAQAHALNKEENLAVETLRKAVVLVPDDVGIRLSLAELLTRQEKIDEAKLQIEHILARDAKQAQALEAMFKLQLAHKDWSSALATATKFGKVYPELARGDHYIGVALEAQGKVPAAIAAYRKAVNKRPDAVEPLMAIVKAYISQQQLHEAISILDDVLKRDPRNFVAQNLRGEVLLLAGNPADAEKSFSTAIELNPKLPTTYRNLGSSRLARNDFVGAVKAYEAGLKQIPDNDMLLYSIAAVDERQGQHDRAIGRYEDLLKRKPQSEMAKNNLAMLLVTHRGDRDSFDRARDLVQGFGASDEPAYLDTVGWVHYRRGEVDQAVTALEQALQKVPSAPLVHYHLGMAYYTKGDIESAQQHLEKALAAKAKFEGIDEARTTLNKLKKS